MGTALWMAAGTSQVLASSPESLTLGSKTPTEGTASTFTDTPHLDPLPEWGICAWVVASNFPCLGTDALLFCFGWFFLLRGLIFQVSYRVTACVGVGGSMGPLLPCLAMGAPLGSQVRGLGALPGGRGRFLSPEHGLHPPGSHSRKAVRGAVLGDWCAKLAASSSGPGRDAGWTGRGGLWDQRGRAWGWAPTMRVGGCQRAGSGLGRRPPPVERLQGRRGSAALRVGHGVPLTSVGSVLKTVGWSREVGRHARRREGGRAARGCVCAVGRPGDGRGAEVESSLPPERWGPGFGDCLHQGL